MAEEFSPGATLRQQTQHCSTAGTKRSPYVHRSSMGKCTDVSPLRRFTTSFSLH